MPKEGELNCLCVRFRFGKDADGNNDLINHQENDSAIGKELKVCFVGDSGVGVHTLSFIFVLEFNLIFLL